MFHGVFKPSFPLSCLVSRLCEAVFGVPPLRGHVFPSMQIPRETLLHKSRSVVKFCDTLSIHCFQLARVVSVCFSSVPWLRCLCTHSHMMSHRTSFRALDQFVCFSCATCLHDSANQKTCLIVSDIRDIQRASQVSFSELILSQW